MRKMFSSFVSVLRISLLLSFFAFFPGLLRSQCDCGSHININPGAYWNRNVLQYDEEGFVTSYTYMFQFPCIATIDDFGREYRLIYREKGTEEWTVGNIYLLPGQNKIGAGPLYPCKTYELRITCPLCPASSPGCTPEEQLQNYFDDPSNTYQNVSRIWEVCYSPIKSQPIKNLRITSVNTNTNSISFKWDHLPGVATYRLKYKKGLFGSWIDVGTTTQYEYQLTNLESCDDYTFQVQGFNNECCGGSESGTAYLDFVATDCMSMLESVDDITHNSAHVSWTFIGTGSSPIDFTVEWGTGNTIKTAITASTDYTITGLSPGSNYFVRIWANCGPQSCSGPSQKLNFQTSCDIREPNNSFSTAAPVPFDANFGNNNISPAGDVDFFKFTPTTCDMIEIIVDHPKLDGFPHPDPAEWVGNDLPYTLYDHNFQEVPKNEGYTDLELRFHQNVHRVTPGQEYYLSVKGVDPTWANLDCYAINTFPCWGCDQLTTNGILGKSQVYTAPSSEIYSLSQSGYHVEWTVTGPAQVQVPNPDYPAIAKLHFTGPGTVTLTALLRRCDGNTASFEKVITVSDECNLTGRYTYNNTSTPMSQTGLNHFQGQGFTITLNIPLGATYNVYVDGGNANFTTNGNQIIVHQISNYAKIRIVLNYGNCTGVQGSYIFARGESPTGDDPFGWMVSPNPTNGLVQIEPVLISNPPIQALPERVEIRIYNQYATLQLEQEGSTASPTSLNIFNLMPGNYTLQLLYGTYLRQFTIVKL